MTERKMCKALADSLNALTPVEREVLRVYAVDVYDASSQWLHDVMIGLAGQALVGTAGWGQALDPALVEALDNLTPVDRRVLTRYVTEDDDSSSPGLHELLYATAMQLEYDEVRNKAIQDEALAPFEADHRAEVEALSAAADWSHVPAPEPRTIDWHPWAVPDDISGLDDEPGDGNVEP